MLLPLRRTPFIPTHPPSCPTPSTIHCLSITCPSFRVQLQWSLFCGMWPQQPGLISRHSLAPDQLTSLCLSFSSEKKSESLSIIPNSEGFSSSLLDSSALAHVQQWEPSLHCECAICVYTVVTVGYTRKPLFGHSDSKGYFCLPSVPFVAIHPRTSNTCCSANLAQCTAQNYKYSVNIYWVNKREKRELLV